MRRVRASSSRHSLHRSAHTPPGSSGTPRFTRKSLTARGCILDPYREARMEKSRFRGEYMRGHFLLAVLVTALFPLSRTANCQFTTASVGGIVTDSSGAVVPGAAVTILSSDTGLSKHDTTGPDGSYLFPALPVGT